MLDLHIKNISVFTIVKLCCRYSPGIFAICFVLTVIDGLLVPIMLKVVAEFINSAMALASYSEESHSMIKNSVYMGFGFLYIQISQELKVYFYELFEDKLRLKLKPDIIKRQFSIEYLLFESCNTQDLLLRVTKDIEGKFSRILKSCNSIITISLQVLGILYILGKYNWWIVISFMFIVIPLILFTFKGGKAVYESQKKVGFITRQMNYLSEVLSNREASAERALFNYSKEINERFKKAHLYRSNYNTKTLARETLKSKGCNIVINIFIVVIIVFLCRQVYSGELNVGLCTSIVGSMVSLTKVLSSQVSELFFEFSSYKEYVKDFKEFLELEENKEGMNSEHKDLKFEKLEIRNVYFKYKDSQNYILKGINLTLEKGKSYSLVGLNGAGKTTLIKIIIGLYREFEGEVLLNGMDIRGYDFNELRRIFGVVSQDYAKYYISLKDNIVLGEKDDDISSVIEKLELKEFIGNLPYREDTYLGKIYDNGIDLSGGQWQKIAIARALYKEISFVILDEPTSSLSPTAKSKIYDNFSKIANDKTLLMISHRLGSTKISDIIVVLDDGSIAEQGTHNELMKRNNIYAKLFREQSGLYYE